MKSTKTLYNSNGNHTMPTTITTGTNFSSSSFLNSTTIDDIMMIPSSSSTQGYSQRIMVGPSPPDTDSKMFNQYLSGYPFRYHYDNRGNLINPGAQLTPINW